MLTSQPLTVMPIKAQQHFFEMLSMAMSQQAMDVLGNGHIYVPTAHTGSIVPQAKFCFDRY